jgi:hypothetical protein
VIDWFEMGGNLKLADTEPAFDALADSSACRPVGQNGASRRRADSPAVCAPRCGDDSEGLHSVDKISRSDERGFARPIGSAAGAQELYRDYTLERNRYKKAAELMAITKYSKWIPSPLDGLSLKNCSIRCPEFFSSERFPIRLSGL